MKLLAAWRIKVKYRNIIIYSERKLGDTRPLAARKSLVNARAILKYISSTSNQVCSYDVLISIKICINVYMSAKAVILCRKSSNHSKWRSSSQSQETELSRGYRESARRNKNARRRMLKRYCIQYQYRNWAAVISESQKRSSKAVGEIDINICEREASIGESQSSSRASIIWNRKK